MASESEDDQIRSSQSSLNGGSGHGPLPVSSLPLFRSGTDFKALARALSTPVDIVSKAESVLDTLMSELDQQDHVEMLQSEMFVCALYMALIDARMPYGPHDPQLKHGYLASPPVTITQLLQKSQTSVKQLLQKMRAVKELLVLSEAVMEHLTSLEKNFCVMCALSHTFDRLCSGVFREEEEKRNLEANEENIPMLPQTEGVAFRKKMGWLLFVHAKKRLMGDNLDLLNGFLALLCCLEYVMRTTPSFLLNYPYDVIRIGCSEYSKTSILSKLCEQFGTNLQETEDMYQKILEPLFKELLNKEGELDLDSLEERYLKQHASEGDLNELLFLTKDPLFFPSNTHSNDSASNGTALQPPMTPVRATLNSIQQLKNTLATAADKPSDKLLDYFQICTNNPGAAIAERVQRMRKLFVSSFVRVSSPFQSVAEPRFTLGVKLYYRMLEQLLNSDSKRLSVSVLETLLNKEDFHTSLIACSLEVVLVAYGLTRSLAVTGGEGEESPFSFPWILDVLQIQAYDFLKVLESFIRVEPTLPSDVSKHLQNIEYKILESIVWKESSSLYDVMRVCDRAVTTPPKNSPTERFTSSAPSPVNVPATHMFLSPVAPRHLGHGTSLSGQSPSTSPAKSSSTTSTSPAKGVTLPRRSQSLTSFFNKVYRLAYHRLQNLCTLLHVNRDLLIKIWTCFENCLNHKPELLKNRHLDQILMCSVYGVCKVLEKDLRFKTIVQEYRNLPHANIDVFRKVYMGGDRYDSIISFYNQLYMVSMKSFLQMFSSRQSNLTLSPVPQPVSPQPSSPAFSVMGRKNFLISPLKESPFKAPRSPSQLTPRSRTLYCFGDQPGSSEKLRSINATVSAAYKRNAELSAQSTPKEKVRRLIQFDQAPPDDNQSAPEVAVKNVVRHIIITPPATDGSSSPSKKK